MKVNLIENIFSYDVRSEEQDEDKSYHIFSFNSFNYTFMIEGNYSSKYKWQVTENETFLSLMSRVDEQYLLDKMSERVVFDLKETKAETIKNINYLKDKYDIDDESLSKKIYDIKAFDSLSWDMKMAEIIPKYNRLNSFNFIVKRHSLSATKAVNIFMTHIQPILKTLNEKERKNDVKSICN